MKYLIIPILILFISCNNNSTNIINIDIDKTNYDNISIIDTIIYLEASNRALIGEVTRLQYDNEHLYILDNVRSNSLFVFDKNGKFINRTNIGNGPGECIEATDFIINDNRVYLWDQPTKRMNIYDKNLKFIDSKTYNDCFIRNFRKINENSFLVFSQTYIDQTPYDYLIYDSTFSRITNKIVTKNDNLLNLSLQSSISRESHPRYLKIFDNNIYAIKSNNELIDYRLDFGKLNITESDMKQGYGYVFEQSKKGKRIVSVDNLVCTNNYIGFSFVLKNQLHSCIHSLTTKKNYFFSPTINSPYLPFQIKGIIEESSTFYGVIIQNETIEKRDYNFGIVLLKLNEDEKTL